MVGFCPRIAARLITITHKFSSTVYTCHLRSDGCYEHGLRDSTARHDSNQFAENMRQTENPSFADRPSKTEACRRQLQRLVRPDRIWRIKSDYQNTFTGYWAKIGSVLTSTAPSTFACATKRRSKGSLCGAGKLSTVRTCSRVIGRIRIPFACC